MRRIAAIAGVVLSLLAGPGRAAEPERLLTAIVPAPSASPKGALARTGQGLGWAGPWGLYPLQGGEPVSLGGREGVTPVGPTGRWMLSAQEPRYGGYFDPQMRGRIWVDSLDPALRITGKGAKPIQPLGWPLAAAERADGLVGAVLWTKGLPLIEGRGHRMVLWSPSKGVVASADWSNIGVAKAGLVAKPDGSWRFLTIRPKRKDDPCGKKTALELITASADLTISRRRSVCVDYRGGPQSIETAGDAWFVVEQLARSIRVLKVTDTATGPKATPWFEIPERSRALSPAPFAVTADGTAFIGLAGAEGWRIYRIAPDWSVSDFALPSPACGGTPERSTTLYLDVIEGVVHATLSAEERPGTCLTVWRL